MRKGFTVIPLDSLLTGVERNIEHLLGNPAFEFSLQADTQPFESGFEVEFALHLPSAASPRDYKEHLIGTLDVGSPKTIPNSASQTSRRLAECSAESQ